MPTTTEAPRVKTTGLMRRQVAVTADSSGQLPERIQIMHTGEWVDSVKGNLDITLADLYEYAANFARGLGQTKDQNGSFIGIPVDFSHEDWKGAALWIKAIEVELTEHGGILWASQVEYTTKGSEALLSGEYKCFSPSFYPRCLGQWYDPEDPTKTATNVIVGGGLTNIPFLKGLTAIMASTSSGVENDDKVYIKADVKGTQHMPTFEEVRAKAPTDLTDDDKSILASHKDELSHDEQVKFGLVTASTSTTGTLSAEDVKILADVKAGNKVIVEASQVQADKEKITKLEADVKANSEVIARNEKERVTSLVTASAAKGKIKTDQIESWVTRVLADSTMQEVLENLPENQVLADAQGSSSVEASTALEEINALATKKVEASVAAGSPITHEAAVSVVMSERTDLADLYDIQIRGGDR